MTDGHQGMTVTTGMTGLTATTGTVVAAHPGGTATGPLRGATRPPTGTGEMTAIDMMIATAMIDVTIGMMIAEGALPVVTCPHLLPLVAMILPRRPLVFVPPPPVDYMTFFQTFINHLK